jgi:hypothetical protein
MSHDGNRYHLIHPTSRVIPHNHLHFWNTRSLPDSRSSAMPPTVRTKDHPRKQYKHSMRKSPYFVSLCFLLAATVLTLLNIYVSGL